MVEPEMIKKFSSFANLEDEEIRAIVLLAEEERFAPNEYIFYEGEKASKLYLMLQGHVEMLMNTNADGTRREMVMTVGPGEVFAWSSLVEPYQLTSSAHCIDRVRAIAISGLGLRALMTINCGLGYRLMHTACKVASERLQAARMLSISMTKPAAN